MSESSVAFWKCDSIDCGGHWTPTGSRSAGRCLRCGDPMPEWAKAGHATDPVSSGPARGSFACHS